MGYTSARGMIEQAGESVALEWHLQANMYPPIRRVLWPVAQRALELAHEQKWSDTLDLPDGVTWRGADFMGVQQAVEAFHLEAFLEGDEA